MSFIYLRILVPHNSPSGPRPMGTLYLHNHITSALPTSSRACSTFSGASTLTGLLTICTRLVWPAVHRVTVDGTVDFDVPTAAPPTLSQHCALHRSRSGPQISPGPNP